jgi:glycosyltransferase involved in cell wall biosynthesis
MGPRISVITPSYNYGRYIDDCLDSVSYQSYAAYEHLIVDDGSSDDSVDRIRRHPGHAKVWEQPNAGLAVTLNHLVKRTSGDWIGWLNADDFYLQGALATVATAIEDDPHLDLIVGDTVFVDENACALRLLPAHPITKSVTLHYGMTAAPSSFFVRRSTLAEIGFREDTKFLMDKWLFADLVDHGARRRYFSTPLGAMRRHEKQVSANARDGSGDGERHAFRSAWNLPVSGTTLSLSRLYGRSLHAGLKVATGGYVREFRWRHKFGQDLRWWEGAPELTDASE